VWPRTPFPGFYGAVWTWTLDDDTKLVPSWLVGRRDDCDCDTFLAELRSRLRPGQVQLTTDGLAPYLAVVEPLFGADRVDYARLIKMYVAARKRPSSRRRSAPGSTSGA